MFSFAEMPAALPIACAGMLGTFAVTGIMIAVVALLNKLTGGK